MAGVEHIFVLMLENRAFDHMLGFSGITGADAQSGRPTTVRGLGELGLRQLAGGLHASSAGAVLQRKGLQWPPVTPISLRQVLTSNRFGVQTFEARTPAPYAMPIDPGHEFPDVVVQLSGPGTEYAPGAAYPPAINTGFVASYAAAGGVLSPGDVMACYGPWQLPVLDTLAREFVVCDNWFSSLPGPTWPNRFFLHAASSGGLDHSPSTSEIIGWEVFDGFAFPNGTIFDRLNRVGVGWRVYGGDDFPSVAGLKGINLGDVHKYADFQGDVRAPDYPAAYTFIEPSYGHVTSDYKCGTSQHPLDDVTRGEALIKCTYEAIRNSPVWDSSLLIITWDEHGGFFDHVPPPSAVAPGDTAVNSGMNQYGFTFEQYGVRVPAVVISPLIPRNLIDHRIHDHASVPATLESRFGLSPMTQRDAQASNLLSLVSLPSPRGDAPPALPAPAPSGVQGCDPFQCSGTGSMPQALELPLPVVRPADTVDEGNLPGFLHSALRVDLALAAAGDKAGIVAEFRLIRTRAEGMQYLTKVLGKVRLARGANRLSSG